MAVRHVVHVVIASLMLGLGEAAQAPSALVLETDGSSLLPTGGEADGSARTQETSQGIQSRDAIGKMAVPTSVGPKVERKGLASITEMTGKEGTRIALNKTEPLKTQQLQEEHSENYKKEVSLKEESSRRRSAKTRWRSAKDEDEVDKRKDEDSDKDDALDEGREDKDEDKDRASNRVRRRGEDNDKDEAKNEDKDDTDKDATTDRGKGEAKDKDNDKEKDDAGDQDATTDRGKGEAKDKDNDEEKDVAGDVNPADMSHRKPRHKCAGEGMRSYLILSLLLPLLLAQGLLPPVAR